VPAQRAIRLAKKSGGRTGIVERRQHACDVDRGDVKSIPFMASCRRITPENAAILT